MRKDLSDEEKSIVEQWITAGVLTRSGEGGAYGLGEAIVVTCSEHITHDPDLYEEDSIVIAVNSGASSLKPCDEDELSREAIVYQFLLDQIDNALNTGCLHCPALSIVLIVDIPCRFADDVMMGIIDQLDRAIRGMRKLKESGCTVSCLLRAPCSLNTIFYTVDDSKWEAWNTNR